MRRSQRALWHPQKVSSLKEDSEGTTEASSMPRGHCRVDVLSCQQPALLLQPPCFGFYVSREPNPAPGHGEIAAVRKQLERGGIRKKLGFMGTKKKTEPVSQPRSVCAGRK